MGREIGVALPGPIALVLVAAIGLAAVGCATADAGPTTSGAPQPVAAPAPAPSATPAAPPATYTVPAAPPGVPPNDPKIDEALRGLDSKMPSGCRKYVNAWCRTTTIPDAYRLQMCASYVTAINSLVTQIRKGGSAIDTCDAMAQGKLPQ